MISTTTLLLLAHLVGLSLAVGAATTKLVLLLKSKADVSLVPVFIKVSKPVTRIIVLGFAILTVSGLGWLLLGYPLTEKLAVKLVLVLTVWGLGPYMDNVVEPKFNKLALEISGPPPAEFLIVQKRYLALEILATAIFYAIIIIWIVL